MSPFAQPSTLDPKLDVVFSLLFGAEQNRHLLSAFINDVVRPPTPFTSVDVLPPRGEHLPVDSERMFPGLRLRLPTGEQVELELQTRPHPALRDRLLLKFSRMYISQLPPSSPPSLFKRCVCILLTNFKELRAARFHSIFQFREAATRELIDDHMEIHILELPKVQSAVDEGEEPSLTRWCQFLAATTDLEREALGKRHPLLAEVKQALDELSRNPEALERAAQRAIELELEQS